MDEDKQKPNPNNSAPQGGIFSTPDLTVDTEKIAQASQTNQVNQAAQVSQTADSNSNQARVTSFFANTDATRQTQRPIASHPLEGDLIINNTSKRPKRKVVIIATLVAILIVGAVVLFAINRPEREDSYSRVKTTFLEFSNFVLNGQASSGELDDSCLETSSCYFTQALQNQEKFEEFYENSAKLKNNLNEALAAWSATTAEKDRELIETSDNEETSSVGKTRLIQEVDGVIEMYDFIYMYSTYSELAKSNIVDYYLENGKTATQNYIANHYETNSGNRYFDELNRDGLAMSEAMLDNINMYAQYGCLNDFVDMVCFTNQATEADQEQVNENNLLIHNYNAELAVYNVIQSQFVNDISEANVLFNIYESEQK